ncbi:hypothetical protein L195_g062140, partial [Trifolium pratense]
MHTSSDDDDDRIQLSSVPAQAPRRSIRNKFPSVRLNDHEFTSDSVVNEDGDLVHLTFMADAEPINWKEAVASSKWNAAMKEELHSIEKNHTW